MIRCIHSTRPRASYIVSHTKRSITINYQDINCSCIPDCSRCTAPSRRTRQSCFHLFRYPLFASAYLRLFAAIITHANRIGDCATRWFYTTVRQFCCIRSLSTVIYTCDDKFSLWISLLCLFCNRYAVRTSLSKRTRSLNHLH